MMLLPRPHHPAAGLRHPVAAVEVDVDHLPELLRRLAGGRHRGADAGVVDQDVDPAELLDGGVDEVLAGGGIGDVGAHRDGLATGAFHQRLRLGQPVDPAGAERHVRAGLGERLREGDTESGRRAGHDRHLAVEPVQVQHAHLAHRPPSMLAAALLGARAAVGVVGGRRVADAASSLRGLLRAEVQPGRAEVVGELLAGACAEDDRADRRPVGQPRQRHLGHRHAARSRRSTRTASTTAQVRSWTAAPVVGLHPAVGVLAEPCAAGRAFLAGVLAGQPAPAERRPRAAVRGRSPRTPAPSPTRSRGRAGCTAAAG